MNWTFVLGGIFGAAFIRLVDFALAAYFRRKERDRNSDN